MKILSKGIMGATIIMIATTMAASAASPESDTTSSKHWRRLRIEHRPALSVLYGQAVYSMRDLKQNLKNAPLLELRLGGESAKARKDSTDIIRYENGYLSLANISNEIGDKSRTAKIRSNMWRVTAASDKGYGYRLANSVKGPRLILTHGDGIQWTKTTLKDQPTDLSDSLRLARFDSKTRFGQVTTAGVRLGVTRTLMVDIEYQRSLMFPYHLFWKWAGSEAIEGLFQAGLDEFVEQIMKSSPAAGPVVGFVLKNGASYGAYELRKKWMNYPFKSTAPLLSDAFKIGLTFTF